MTISKITKDTVFEGVLLLQHVETKKTKTGKNYLELTFADATGSIGAKWWSPPSELPVEGRPYSVTGNGNEFNGATQLIVNTLKPAPADVDYSQFVPSAARDAQSMLEEVLDTVKSFQDTAIQNIVLELLHNANQNGQLLTFPAAKQLHHAERGGLLHHTTDILKLAKALADIHPWLNRDLLFAGVIIHDLGKLTELQTDDTGLATDYTLEGRLVGHLVRGAIEIERAAQAVQADPEKTVLLQHLILSHHGKYEFGCPVLPKLPEAEALSTLDLLDARLFEMQEALQAVKPGGFSSKIWCLENREIYKPTQPDDPSQTP